MSNKSETVIFLRRRSEVGEPRTTSHEPHRGGCWLHFDLLGAEKQLGLLVGWAGILQTRQKEVSITSLLYNYYTVYSILFIRYIYYIKYFTTIRLENKYEYDILISRITGVPKFRWFSILHRIFDLITEPIGILNVKLAFVAAAANQNQITISNQTYDLVFI